MRTSARSSQTRPTNIVQKCKEQLRFDAQVPFLSLVCPWLAAHGCGSAASHFGEVRVSSPHCRSPSLQSKPSECGATRAQLTAEPDSSVAWHLSRRCPRGCRRATYRCRYMIFFWPDFGKRGHKEKQIDLPNPSYFFHGPAAAGIAR